MKDISRKWVVVIDIQIQMQLNTPKFYTDVNLLVDSGTDT